MKNPPDFVMYVVMVRLPGETKFMPSTLGRFALAFRLAGDARKKVAEFQEMLGKENAYVQQYGPIS